MDGEKSDQNLVAIHSRDVIMRSAQIRGCCDETHVEMGVIILERVAMCV